MICTQITVIVTVFNQSLESIERTLRSVANQKNCNYQLLIADDHSEVDNKQEIDSIINKLGICDYCYIRHDQNVQTVRNILKALNFASGKYVKVIGAGDELYDSDTLLAIVDFCEKNNVKAGFGNIIVDSADKSLYRAPKYPNRYFPHTTDQRNDNLKQQLLNADWIPGCCQFFDCEYLKHLLRMLAEEYEVRYCEDFAQTIALFEQDVFYLDRPILVYEWGSGVSTTGGMESRKKLYADHEKLYKKLTSKYPENIDFAKAYKHFKLRKFLALRTPIYPILHRITANNYMKSNIS